MKKPTLANPDKLSESLCKRLNLYAATTGAACVGMLTVTPPASAQVVYTPAHIVIGSGNSYFLDLGSYGFTFSNKAERLTVAANFGFTCYADCLSTLASNAVEVKSSKSLLPLALSRGAEIGSSKAFHFALYGLMADVNTSGKFGNFVNVKNRYLGFTFYNCGRNPSDHYNYGWARFTVHVNPNNDDMSVLLSGYAYESRPNVPIRAGQMSGTADDPVYAPETNDPESDSGVRSEPEPISQTVQQAPLGLLALGAQGLAFWRREHPVDAQE